MDLVVEDPKKSWDWTDSFFFFFLPGPSHSLCSCSYATVSPPDQRESSSPFAHDQAAQRLLPALSAHLPDLRLSLSIVHFNSPFARHTQAVSLGTCGTARSPPAGAHDREPLRVVQSEHCKPACHCARLYRRLGRRRCLVSYYCYHFTCHRGD